MTTISDIRRKAREQLGDGAITQNYGGKVEDAVALLNHAVATEIVCILRYKFHALCATGIASEAVKQEFAQHATEEEQHLDLLTERINQIGGRPNLNPDGVLSRAASEYVEGQTLVDMIREDLVAERIAIETYREMVRYFGDRDPTTRVLLEKILAQEEEHANDMRRRTATAVTQRRAAPPRSAAPTRRARDSARRPRLRSSAPRPAR
jgi:bacterioferritin